jgi:hypothetical protein
LTPRQTGRLIVGRNINLTLSFDVTLLSAPQFPTHYSPAGNGDVLDIVVHKSIKSVTRHFYDILDSDHLPVLFHIPGHVKINNFSEPTEKFTDWDRFISFASELISHKVEINSGIEVDKAERDFTAAIVSAYRLSTSKITLLFINNDLPDLDLLLK